MLYTLSIGWMGQPGRDEMNNCIETYSAVVESGSCDLSGRFWGERSHCGHAHRTVEGAQKCLDKNQRTYCRHGHRTGSLCRECGGEAGAHSTSAEWYGGTIHTGTGERI